VNFPVELGWGIFDCVGTECERSGVSGVGWQMSTLCVCVFLERTTITFQSGI